MSQNFYYPKNAKIMTTNWIYDKTQYVELQILPKPWKSYTIQDGVDGDILQVWWQAAFAKSSPLSKPL